MSVERAICRICGEPMPEGEEMFNYHGYSGRCPKPPLNAESPATFTQTDLSEQVTAKNAAYHERDQLVCALSKLFPSSLERHPDSDATWEDDWRWIVFIDLPTGQVSWHIHDSELRMFDHLKHYAGKVWDGHTTPEKYVRLAALKVRESAREREPQEKEGHPFGNSY